MGDRVWTSIEFSGEISEDQGEELVGLLKDQGCENNDYGSKVDLDALRSDTNFYDNECNYGFMADVEGWCKDNRVSYLKTWAQGGDYGPGMELYDASTGGVYERPAIESEPALTLDELVKHQAAGTTDQLISDLRRFTGFSGRPTLRVLKVEDWTDELCHFMAKRALLEDA